MDVLKLSDSSFEMPLDPSWEVTYFDEDDSKADVRFNSEKYPVLGVKIISIDAPKYNKAVSYTPLTLPTILLV